MGRTDDSEHLNRRDFAKRVVAASSAFAAPLIIPRHVWGGPNYTPPSETITRAVIGTGGMGMNHVVTNVKGQTPVTLAVCDVDSGHLARALERAGEGCVAYSDWRAVLDRQDIDTIHIATPPHWHALIGIAAAQAGFDLFSEKPFTRTIHEGQVYRDTVARYGRMLQINTHGRFGNYYGYGATRALEKLVRSGLLGTPLTVRVGRRQGFNWKIREWSGRTNLTPQAVPSELDYDLWLGPAPVKPYHPHRVHGSFRGYWDYDGGGLTDMGQHYLDPVQYILGKDGEAPVSVDIDADPQDSEAIGTWRRMEFTYADGCKIV
ncbi:MAG: Gfo/Idh/MocA family oxidoreductase, partial [Planctomycetes bacterium]|nr:Gfo/Idh/MocA family oxidoreductase [Planctomycetota bacterium]